MKSNNERLETIEQLKELKKDMEKIMSAMRMSKSKQMDIEKQKQEVRQEFRPVILKENEEKLANMEREKSEFDEMTERALINAQRKILQIDELVKEQQEGEVRKYVEGKAEIKRKLESIKARADFSEEKKALAEQMATRKIEEGDKDITDFMKKCGLIDKELDMYENMVKGYANELNIEDKLKDAELDYEQEPEKEKSEAEYEVEPEVKSEVEYAVKPEVKYEAKPEEKSIDDLKDDEIYNEPEEHEEAPDQEEKTTKKSKLRGGFFSPSFYARSALPKEESTRIMTKAQIRKQEKGLKNVRLTEEQKEEIARKTRQIIEKQHQTLRERREEKENNEEER